MPDFVDTQLVTARDEAVHVVLAKDETVAVWSQDGARGKDGDPGPPGPAGGTTADYLAGETIHGRRAVFVFDGQAFHPNTSNNAHAQLVLGIALTSTLVGETVTVQSSGIVTNAGWTWSPGFVYCGMDGVLTQSPLSTGWLLSIGRAIAADAIEVDIDTPFIRI